MARVSGSIVGLVALSLAAVPLQAGVAPAGPTNSAEIEAKAKAISSQVTVAVAANQMDPKSAERTRFKLDQLLEHERFLKRRFGDRLSSSDCSTLNGRLDTIERELPAEARTPLAQ